MGDPFSTTMDDRSRRRRGGRAHRACVVGALAVGLLLQIAFRADALSVRALGLDELAGAADRIFVGRCLARREIPAGPGSLAAVETTFTVTEWVKRSRRPAADDEVLTVRQIAGLDREMGPRFAPGQEVLLFLHAEGPSGLTSPVGMGQGAFVVLRRPRQDGPDLAVTEAGAHVFARSASAGHTASRHRLVLEDAGERGRTAVPLDALLVEIRALVGVADR